MRKTLLVVSLVACAAIVFSSSARAAENWLGTWKLDVAKSSFVPAPGPRSLTLKFQATKAGIKFNGDGVSAEGKPTHTQFVSKFDGQEVPYKGNPDADTASAKRIDDNNYENTWKKAGKPTVNAKVVVSEDGNTMTITQVGTNAKGQAVNSTYIYSRQ